MRDFQRLPDAALLRVDEIVSPDGPLPWRRTKFLDLVAKNEAPQPVIRGHGGTFWTWGHVRTWLERLAGDTPREDT